MTPLADAGSFTASALSRRAAATNAPPARGYRLRRHRDDLGWRQLRPVQDLATAASLDGCDTVVLAPTAGRKTEAGLFPVLSRILSEELAARDVTQET